VYLSFSSNILLYNESFVFSIDLLMRYFQFVLFHTNIVHVFLLAILERISIDLSVFSLPFYAHKREIYFPKYGSLHYLFVLAIDVHLTRQFVFYIVYRA